MQKFDVLIVGAGMVGLTLALAIRKTTKLTVALADTTPLSEITDDPSVRVSAINQASKQIFSRLGVWPAICEKRLQAYQHMHVWDKAGYGKLAFSSTEQSNIEDAEQLGWIIENDVIRHSLWNKAQQDEGITFFTQEKITNIGVGDSEVFASFPTQMPITAKLLVGADGANSWVRNQMDMPLTFRDYDHHAIVATVECSLGHQNTAWQVFLPSGPLAFLPLNIKKSIKSNNTDQCSIVWSTSPGEAKRLMTLSTNECKDEFSKELTAASDGKLGNIKLVSNAFSFPLKMRLSQSFVKQRVALVGDAAHTIHPLAGQGVNLGLLDAVSLSQVITDEIINLSESADTDSYNYEDNDALWANSTILNKYSRWRKSEATEMIAAMEAIKQAFTPQQKLTQIVRGLGMTLFDNIPAVKNALIKQALGLKGNLPDLAEYRRDEKI